jgi:hypothetical protein
MRRQRQRALMAQLYRGSFIVTEFLVRNGGIHVAANNGGWQKSKP